MNEWLLILAGLLTLLVSGDVLVRGAVWIAESWGVRPMVIGATVVAFGTSAPELAAAVVAALEGEASLATGTVLGSNIANIGLIVGVTAAARPILHAPGSARFEVRCLLVLTLLSPLPLLLGEMLTRPEGLALIAFLVWFTLALLGREKRSKRAQAEPVEPPPPRTRPAIALHAGMILLGCGGLPLGAHWMVQGASGIAEALGMSTHVVGVVIVALGTSLPELAASLVAARKGHPELALGNVLGSNIFNFCMVLGCTSVITPLPFTRQVDGPDILVGIALTAWLAFLLGARGGVSRTQGGLLMTAYFGYISFLLLR